MKRTVIINAKIIVGDAILENKDVVIEDEIIADIVPHGAVLGEVIDAKGRYLSAGFIDIHVHGGGGADFMDGAGGYVDACNSHSLHGTTTIVPTTISADFEQTKFAIEQFNIAKQDKRIKIRMPGLHLEGPYLCPAMAGAMKPELLKAPCEREYMALYEASQGNIIRWTAAPELEGALELGRAMADRGVVMSMGHSDATYDDVKRAIDNGYSLVTHLYSACSSIKRMGGFRHAGIVESAYLFDDLNVEIIADGCHLPNQLLEFVTKFKKTENIALITDAMRAACQDVEYSFLGSKESPQPVIIEDGVAKLLDRQAFGGSIATTDRLVRTMKNAGIPLTRAVRMMTETPASFLKLQNVGKLQKGYCADLVLFDENINVSKVMVKGEFIK